MNPSPNVAIVAALAWIVTVGIAATTFLTYVDKPFVATAGFTGTGLTALVVYGGIKLIGGSPPKP